MTVEICEGEPFRLAQPCCCGSPLGTVERWELRGGFWQWIVLCAGADCIEMWDVLPHVDILPLDDVPLPGGLEHL